MNEIKTVVQQFIDQSGINAYTRKREVVYSRYVVYNFLRKLHMTLTEIGNMFDRSGRNGFIDHATVLHGIREYSKLKDGSYSDFEVIRKNVENELHPLIDSQQNDFNVIQEPIALMNISIELSKLYACNDK